MRRSVKNARPPKGKKIKKKNLFKQSLITAIHQIGPNICDNRTINNNKLLLFKTMEDKPIDLNAEPDNGSVFSCYYLPEEVVGYILSCVRWEDLLSCRLVCHLWKDLIDSFVPSDKTWRDHKDVLITSFDSPFKSLRAHHMPFYLWYAIAKNVFGRNLLKNTFGEGKICYDKL